VAYNAKSDRWHAGQETQFTGLDCAPLGIREAPYSKMACTCAGFVRGKVAREACPRLSLSGLSKAADRQEKQRILQR